MENRCRSEGGLGRQAPINVPQYGAICNPQGDRGVTDHPVPLKLSPELAEVRVPSRGTL